MERELLDLLLNEISVTGEEYALQEKLEAHMAPYTDVVCKDAIGDGVYGLEGTGKKILFSAHIDEIGLMVSGYTSDGFLKVTNAGGIQARTYPGHTVKILSEGKGLIYGSVVNNPKAQKNTDFSVKNLLVDIGAKDKEEAEKVCSIGDRIVQDTTVRSLLNDRIAARGLDDRSGVFTIMEALKRAKDHTENTILCAATVGEEVGAHGAKWVAERMHPDEAIVVDVTYVADTDGMADEAWGDVKLGEGPVILINPMCDRNMVKTLRKLAKDNDIPCQLEICGGRSCTDGDQIHLAGEGIPTALVSIPLRYMHTPSEVADEKDLENVIRLLSLYMQEA